MLAKDAVLAPAVPVAARLGEAAGVFALRIVDAGDEGAEAAAAQGQPPVGAALRSTEGAFARVAAILLGRKQEVGEIFVQRLGHFRGHLLHHLVGLRLEVLPEAREQHLVFLAPVRDDVELVLHPGGEIIGDIGGEEAFEEGGQQTAGFLGEEAVFLHADIGAVAQGLDGRGVGRRAPDAKLLQPLDQRSFREARRRLGEVLGGLDRALGRHVARLHLRQQAAVLVLAVVQPFLIDRKEAGEADHLPRGAQFMASGGIAEGDRGAFQLRGRHLAGHRALENEVVKPRFIRTASAFAGEIGRADRLVRFLRVLGLGAVEARLFRQVGAVIARLDRIAQRHDRARVHLHAIGPHIGDRARFVERLRAAHGVLRRETELARGLLLQGRCGERRRGVALQRLGLDALHGEAPGFHRGLGLHRDALIAEAEALQLHALERHEPRVEFRPVVLHPCQHAPVFLRAERLDLALPLDDQAQRDRLHAPRALGPGELPPQHRREGEAEQVVERAPRQIGVDQGLIELAGLGHRLGHGLLGDRVEGDAGDLLGQRLPLRQQIAHVPADRLALAIRVGRQNEAGRALGRVGNLFEAALLVAIEFPLHRKVVLRLHAAILGRQIADMAIGSEDLVVLAEILLDGLRLGGRFYDDKLHGILGLSLRVYVHARVGRRRLQRQEASA